MMLLKSVLKFKTKGINWANTVRAKVEYSRGHIQSRGCGEYKSAILAILRRHAYVTEWPTYSHDNHDFTCDVACSFFAE